jgi:hypothetical protein
LIFVFVTSDINGLIVRQLTNDISGLAARLGYTYVCAYVGRVQRSGRPRPPPRPTGFAPIESSALRHARYMPILHRSPWINR